MAAIRHNSLIDFYRILFSLLIVCYHSQSLTDRGRVPFLGAYVGVEFFFILSGFLLSKSAWNKDCPDRKSIAEVTIHEIKKRAINMYYYFIPAFFISFIALNFEQLSMRTILFGLQNSVFEFLFLQIAGLGELRYVSVIWYFSALLLCMLFIYPLMLHLKEVFFSLVAPLCAVFCYGYLYVTYGNLALVHEWNGYLYVGMIRAVAGICLGSFCCFVSLHTPAKDARSGKFSCWLVTGIELILLAVVLYYMYVSTQTHADFFLVLIFFALVYLAFTRNSFLNAIFDNKVFRFFGKFSVPLYLSHGVFYLRDFTHHPNWPLHFFFYMSASIALALAVYIIGNLFMRFAKRCSQKLKSIL